MKKHNIILAISSVLIITGAILQVLHIKIGISGAAMVFLSLSFVTVYQQRLISKLTKQLENNNKISQC